jgi:hypothetical protein
MTVNDFVTRLTKANEELAATFNKNIETSRQHLGELAKDGETIAEAAWPAATKLAEKLTASSKDSIEAAQRLFLLAVTGQLLRTDGGFSEAGRSAIGSANASISAYFGSLAEYQKACFDAQRSLAGLAGKAREAAVALTEETASQTLNYAETCVAVWGNLVVDSVEAAASGTPTAAPWYEVAR